MIRFANFDKNMYFNRKLFKQFDVMHSTIEYYIISMVNKINQSKILLLDNTFKKKN